MHQQSHPEFSEEQRSIMMWVLIQTHIYIYELKTPLAHSSSLFNPGTWSLLRDITAGFLCLHKHMCLLLSLWCLSTSQWCRPLYCFHYTQSSISQTVGPGLGSLTRLCIQLAPNCSPLDTIGGCLTTLDLQKQLENHFWFTSGFWLLLATLPQYKF